MIKKTTAIAPSNIAFIKYWGLRDPEIRIPTNNSISMNLDSLSTVTTVEFSKFLKRDEITIDGKKNPDGYLRSVRHLDRIRNLAGKKIFASVMSNNNFPKDTGLSSSASGFAALTLAAVASIGLSLNEKELSILSRLGSGSSCRSIPDGFVEWQKGNSHTSSYAKTIFPAKFWNISDVVVILENYKKDIPTTESMRNAFTSLFFKERLNKIDYKLTRLKNALKNKNFTAFGEIIENEALEMHSIILTQKPSQIYLRGQTVNMMHFTRKLRKKGLEVYFTVNTGHNVHLLCEDKNIAKVLKSLKLLKYIKKIIINKPAKGTGLTKEHLF